MNKDRRARLQRAIDLLSEVQENYAEALRLVSECADEEQEAYDNLTEGLQAAERGERMQEVAGELQSVQGELENIDIESLVSQLEGCME